MTDLIALVFIVAFGAGACLGVYLGVILGAEREATRPQREALQARRAAERIWHKGH